MIMASDHHWDHWVAEKMLDLYLHDYLVKKKFHNTAAIFSKEANVGENPVAIDSFDGFLHEWWTLFYDVYASRQLEHQEAKAKSSVKDGEMTENELQNIRPIVPQLPINQQRPVEFPIGPSYKMLGQTPACVFPARMYGEEKHLRHPIRALNPNLNLRHGNKLNLLKSAASSPSYLEQQFQNHAQQQNRNYSSVGGANPTETTLLGVQKGIFPRTSSHDAEVNPVPPNRWLLSSLMQTPNHPQTSLMLTEQRQHNLLLPLTSGNLISAFPGNSANFDSPKLRTQYAQTMVQKVMDELQNQHDQCLQPQLPEELALNGKKRRRMSHSRTRNKTLGCTNPEADKPMDENVESFLSNGDEEDDNKGTSLGTLKHRSTAHCKNDHKGFTFEEIGCLHSSKGKVSCCHFSSDGKLLASAGHDKKVFIWNVETFNFINSSEGHSLLVTDVRFRPNSTIFATSSFDRTLQIWDAAKPSRSLFKLLGHAEQVTALDFHPRKVDLLCSCDSNDEIRLWNVNRSACLHISKQLKGATKQLRFQPQYGKLLATASGNSVNVIDVENDRGIQFNLKGHAKEVLSLCWDVTGKYIASVSEDSARLWSLVSGGRCMRELHTSGNRFQSCAFHPGYSQLLIIGSYQSLEFWNTIEVNKTWSFPAHNGLIAALADSLETEMIASASHDQCVKLWK